MSSSSCEDVECDDEPVRQKSTKAKSTASAPSTNIHIKKAKNIVVDGTIIYNERTVKKGTRKRPLGIIWDTLTCPSSQEKSNLELISTIQETFTTDGYKENMFIFLYDRRNESQANIDDMRMQKVTFQPVVANENSIVFKLKESIQQFAVGEVTGKMLVVISDHVNNKDIISFIRTRKIPDVHLVHNNAASTELMKSTEFKNHLFSDIACEIPDHDHESTKKPTAFFGKGNDQFPPLVNQDIHVPNMGMGTYVNGIESKKADDIETDAEPERRSKITSQFQFNGDGSTNDSNWKRGKRIGSGGFGKVFKVKDGPGYPEIKMAVKQVECFEHDTRKKEEAIFKELEILKTLQHPRIVTYYGFCEAEEVLSLFMERIKGGSLEKYLKDERNKPLDIKQMRSITQQMLEGVSYLHTQRMIHRDIKSGNILIEENLEIKLADFGVSKVFKDISKATTKPIGTHRWMAPEMFDESKHYSYKVDIWSIGCTVIEMLTREYPFPNLKEEQHVLRRLITNPDPTTELPKSCPPELIDFFSVVFQTNDTQRPSAKELLDSNPFVTGKIHDK